MGPKKDPTEPFNKWDSIERMLKLLQPVMIGVLTVITAWIGLRANAAVSAAQQTAKIVQAGDSARKVVLDSILISQDTIHRLVDGTKSRLDTLVYGLQVENTALREQLRKHGIVVVVPAAPHERSVNP